MDATGTGDFNAIFSRGTGGRTVDLRVVDLFSGRVEFKIDDVVAMGLFDPENDGGEVLRVSPESGISSTPSPLVDINENLSGGVALGGNQRSPWRPNRNGM